jgi:hypothetical protein
MRMPAAFLRHLKGQTWYDDRISALRPAKPARRVSTLPACIAVLPLRIAWRFPDAAARILKLDVFLLLVAFLYLAGNKNNRNPTGI